MQINLGSNNIYQPDYDLERSKLPRTVTLIWPNVFTRTMLGVHFDLRRPPNGHRPSPPEKEVHAYTRKFVFFPPSPSFKLNSICLPFFSNKWPTKRSDSSKSRLTTSRTSSGKWKLCMWLTEKRKAIELLKVRQKSEFANKINVF